jgi:hypothetical protein
MGTGDAETRAAAGHTGTQALWRLPRRPAPAGGLGVDSSSVWRRKGAAAKDLFAVQNDLSHGQ